MSSFKAPVCPLSLQVNRFPFIDAFNDDEEKRDPFVSVDGSVGYMFESAVAPRKIYADNPMAKVR